MKITHLILPNPNNLTGTLIWDEILIISCTNRNHKISRKFDKKKLLQKLMPFCFYRNCLHFARVLTHLF